MKKLGVLLGLPVASTHAHSHSILIVALAVAVFLGGASAVWVARVYVCAVAVIGTHSCRCTLGVRGVWCVAFWVWALTNWAMVTPTNAADTTDCCYEDEDNFCLLHFFFTSTLLLGLAMVWMLAETVVKRFFETVFPWSSMLKIGFGWKNP